MCLIKVSFFILVFIVFFLRRPELKYVMGYMEEKKNEGI